MGFNGISMCRVQGSHPATLCNNILARLSQRVGTELKGNQSLLKKPAVHLAHLEEEDPGDVEDPESDDPSRIEGVTKEFMVCLARAVKDAQADEKCCYHYSSLEHFIHNCPLVKTSRDKKQLNWKEGLASMKGAQTPQTMTGAMKSPQMEAPEA